MVETAPVHGQVTGDPELHFLEWPHPGEAVALLIHGSFGNSAVWSDLGSRLVTQLRVLAPDLRGHGASGWPAGGDYTLDAVVSDMERLLSELAPRGPLVVIGHSLGNIVATRLAGRISQRVNGLVLVDHALRIEQDHREHLIGAGRRPHREFATVDEAVAWATRLAGPAADPTIASGVAAANFVSEGGGYRQAFDQRFLATLGDWDSERDASLVLAPVLVVRAGVSPVLRDAGVERMRSRFQSVEFVTLADAGHNVFIEKPAEFASIVSSFLAGVM